jgi:ribose-phosphate pyrophosphokinase
MKQYASRVVDCLAKFPGFADESINGVELLKTDQFADNEMEVVVNETVREKHVILFTSCARNQAEIGTNEAKMELYHAIDALKRSQPAKITVFEPFVSCSRSDRATRRSSVGLWVHLKTLASLGADHIITYQLHSDKSKSMVNPTVCAFDDIPALRLLKQHLCDAYIQSMNTLETEVRPNWAFCSVDAGGEKLARVFANAFGAPLVVAHKQRDSTRLNAIESIYILTAEPLKNKVLWIVDDMIDTAGSVEKLVRALALHEPAEINIIAVHALFSSPASQRLSKLAEEGLLKRIIVTDTVCCPPALQNQIPGLEVVPSAKLSARIVRATATNASMSKLFDRFDAGKYLQSPNLFNQ